MKRLRDELTTENLRVIVTTSTHILYEPDEPFAEDGDEEKVRNLLNSCGYVYTGKFDKFDAHGNRKITSPGEEKLRKLLNLCDVMLIEADGARGRHVKLPSEREPMIYPWSDLVIALAGADSIGKSIESTAYRPVDLAAFLDKAPEDIIDCEDIVKLAVSDKALKKGVGSGDYRFYLNATDESDAKPEDIEVLMKRLRGEYGVEACCGSMKNIGKIGAVILAAGLSSRFGDNKLEKPVGGKPMYRHVLDEIASVTGYENICFVTGPAGASSVAEEVSKTGAKVIINEHPEDGISSSMKKGLRANMHMGSCLFAVADQPFINRESVRDLIDGYSASDRCMASLVNVRGEAANPCIFSYPYYDELLEIEGDHGGKGIITAHPDDVYMCPARDERELEDIDTAADYERIIGQQSALVRCKEP